MGAQAPESPLDCDENAERLLSWGDGKTPAIPAPAIKQAISPPLQTPLQSQTLLNISNVAQPSKPQYRKRAIQPNQTPLPSFKSTPKKYPILLQQQQQCKTQTASYTVTNSNQPHILTTTPQQQNHILTRPQSKHILPTRHQQAQFYSKIVSFNFNKPYMTSLCIAGEKTHLETQPELESRTESEALDTEKPSRERIERVRARTERRSSYSAMAPSVGGGGIPEAKTETWELGFGAVGASIG